jgi:prevent-host-death family protein
MREVNASEAKGRFGEMLDLTRQEPVAISRAGKRVAVMLSAEEYEQLQSLEDIYWGAMAEGAAKLGRFLSPEESMRYLQERMAKS